jgi:hypothetical protein
MNTNEPLMALGHILPIRLLAVLRLLRLIKKGLTLSMFELSIMPKMSQAIINKLLIIFLELLLLNQPVWKSLPILRIQTYLLFIGTNQLLIPKIRQLLATITR